MKHPSTPIIIENISPEIDGGLFAAKIVTGESLKISADIYKDGHERLGAAVRWTPWNRVDWHEAPMKFVGNDRWEASVTFSENNRFYYTVVAWMDPLATWLDHVKKKAGVDLTMPPEWSEGVMLLRELIGKLRGKKKSSMEHALKELSASKGVSQEILRIASQDEFLSIAGKTPLRHLETVYEKKLDLFVDRKRAAFGAWYEFFPRSQSSRPGKHGTFKDCAKRIPDIKKMGFDVIYLPPIHPIGTSHRKGKNNSLTCRKGDVGSTWAIGSKDGGHKAVHPKLGTVKDFEAFTKAAAKEGIEIALDFAAQCSPDHPYVKNHPEWFYRLPDGTIRYAENPPKKYQDIYPLNFYCENKEALFNELKSVFIFWIKRGVRIFRVDNPHTKSLKFWHWLIRGIQDQYPDVIFLAEAFTRPTVMKYLAKAGFTQSYTYFTWRYSKWDLRTYLEELTRTDVKHYFRPNFFANTPDILAGVLRGGNTAAFKLRMVLAATLSSSYGIYSGYELGENAPFGPDSEEYLDSEKYEIKVRDWNKEGNIKDLITRVNRIRNRHPALQQFKNIEFLGGHNEAIIGYLKWTDDRKNLILTVLNLDPDKVQEDLLYFPCWDFGIEHWQTFKVVDLLTGEKYFWKGAHHYVRLDPSYQPAHIFEVKR
jgi:starch synthase (maltosyl-transferring)